MELDTLLGRLRGSRSWGATVAPLQQHLLRRPEDAIEVAAALDRDLGRHGEDIAVAAVRDSLFSIVSRSHDEGATDVAFQLATAAPGQHPSTEEEPGRARLAMELAAVRPASEVHALLDGGQPLRSDAEFGLLLLHELVLRRRGVPECAADYVAWAERTRHPLAALPLHLIDVETGLPGEMRMFGPDPGGSWGTLVELQPADPVPLATLLPGLRPPVAGDGDGDGDGIAAVFEGWAAPGYGVDVQRRSRGPGFSAVTGRPSPAPQTPAEVLEFDAVLRAMFCASVAGGASTHGPGGAWSRLRVWRAIATILGTEWPSPLDDVAERAGSWRWIALAIGDDDPWFEKVAWNFWCLADDGELVVAVGATGSD